MAINMSKKFAEMSNEELKLYEQKLNQELVAVKFCLRGRAKLARINSAKQSQSPKTKWLKIPHMHMWGIFIV